MFRVVVVCHANLCRSPMAEHVLRRALGPSVSVGSAGTHAWADSPMHPFAAEVLAESGIDGSGFRSRVLTAALVSGADLVLTATRRERSACVSLDPASVRRCFTINQFTRYAVAVRSVAALPSARLRDVLVSVPLIRAGLPVVPGEQDDLPDPVGRSITAFRDCRTVLERAAALTAGNPSPPVELLR
jgi:protein-tyrosine phosphatase